MVKLKYLAVALVLLMGVFASAQAQAPSAAQGLLFTDHCGQPSCTAGRADVITGQIPVRTGMTTIGIPGSTSGSATCTT